MDNYDRQEVSGRFQAKLRGVQNGNFGSCESVGDGVFELKIHFGTGYRIYFGQDGDLVILLCGGTKDTQTRDIKTAKEYWEDYNA